ncbi:hypothetical protein TKK_0004792 [Trichogramma kaykai]
MSPISVIFTLLCLYHGLPTAYSCNYRYDYNCANHTTVVKPCSRHHLPAASEVTFSIIEDHDRSNHSSIVVVEFPTPSENCELEVQLYVAPGINDEEDCMDYTFNMRDSHPHTSSKYICPENKQRPNLSANSSCVREIAEVWFNHVYTGCYSFVFIADKSYYEFRKKAFLETTYKKTEVVTPMVSCNVQSTFNETHKEFEIAEVTATISLVFGSPFAKLAVVRAKDNSACKGDTIVQEIHDLLPVPFEIDQSCSIETRSVLENGTRFQNLYCRFPVGNNPVDSNYCFYMTLHDARCSVNTIWRPPGDPMYPCNWSLKCSRGGDRDIKNATATLRIPPKDNSFWSRFAETLHIKFPFENNHTKYLNNVNFEKTPPPPRAKFYFATVVVLALIGSFTICCLLVAAVYFLYRRYPLRKCRRADDESPASPAADGDNVEMQPLGQEQAADRRDIMLMYVKDDQQFMGEMTNLQRQLQGRTGASVYSWWTPSVFQNVSAEGAYEWATTRISQGCRVVWFDTKKARELLTSVVEGTPVYADHRDENFNRVLQHVVRTKDPNTEYHVHHVARFTKPAYAVPDTNDINDPFSEIAVNTRFILPQGMDNLVKSLRSE